MATSSESGLGATGDMASALAISKVHPQYRARKVLNQFYSPMIRVFQHGSVIEARHHRPPEGPSTLRM